ncbi:MAG: hypothetical protein WCQ77_16465, partial [Planctomycetota bacterium]
MAHESGDDWVNKPVDEGGGVGELFVSVSDETFAAPKPTPHGSRMRSIVISCVYRLAVSHPS